MSKQTNNSSSDFIATLQREAALQSRLNSTRLLPAKLDSLTALIGRYPWQSVLVVSFCAALITELLRWEVLR